MLKFDGLQSGADSRRFGDLAPIQGLAPSRQFGAKLGFGADSAVWRRLGSGADWGLAPIGVWRRFVAVKANI